MNQSRTRGATGWGLWVPAPFWGGEDPQPWVFTRVPGFDPESARKQTTDKPQNKELSREKTLPGCIKSILEVALPSAFKKKVPKHLLGFSAENTFTVKKSEIIPLRRSFSKVKNYKKITCFLYLPACMVQKQNMKAPSQPERVFLRIRQATRAEPCFCAFLLWLHWVVFGVLSHSHV